MKKAQNKAKQMLNEQEGGSSFDFSAIPGLCISNWFWFVLCVTITCSAAFVYLRITQPIYVRSASLVVKDSKEGEAIDNVFTRFRNGKSIMPNTSLNNEIIAFRKKDLMEQVVKQLSLDTKYEVRGHLRSTTLYGSSLPIIAHFSSDRINTEFDIDINCKYIICGSDGIFEFLTNEKIAHIINKYYKKNEPKECCNTIVKKSIELWSKYDTVIDDNSIILIFFNQ